MTPERWNKIQTLFDSTLELSVLEREPYLQRQCADDPEMYSEVSSLLGADANIHKLLEGLAIDAVGLSYERQYIGARIGPYRVVEHIGSGGMSYVFLADWVDGQFKQRVALKLIKRGMESEHIIRRFRSERQILSRLNHPNIAGLLDGGITEDGTPYFTMDYIDGVPIDRYCDENRLTVNERLELFGTVCRAVQYAHSNLVIHRDLKPGNIFVDKDGTVKLLDFGIAKVLGEGEDGLLLTRTGIRVMTPEYASPEQVRLQPVTTATDVYALGIVLYELLTGQRLYSVSDSSPSEMERIVCTVQPNRPSTTVPKISARDTQQGSSESTMYKVAANRNTTLPRLRNLLRYDLDTICMTALYKEPERRYQSVEQLLRDVERYRQKLPISARPDTAVYRLHKFIRRYKSAVTATILVVLLISSLIVYYTLRLSDERNAARFEAAKSDEIAKFLTGLFEISDPSEGRGETVTARELLDQGASRIRVELADQPELRSTMMDVIGTVYHSLGLFGDAQPLLEEALDTRRLVYGNSHPLVASSLNNLALTLQERGDFASAEEMINEALDIQRSQYTSAHEDIAISLFNLGEIRRLRGDQTTAQQLFTESYDMYKAVHGGRHPSAANVLHSIAVLQDEQADYDSAEKNYIEALNIFENVYGEYHPDIGNTLNNLASMYRHRGEYEKAEPLYLRALDVRQRVLNSDHPDLAYTYNHMGRLYQFTERYLRQSVEHQRRALPEGHVNLAYPLVSLGNLLNDTGRPAEAESYLHAALELRENNLPPGHHLTEVVRIALGTSYFENGDYTSAENLFNAAYKTLRDRFGEDNKHTLRAAEKLAELRNTGGE